MMFFHFVTTSPPDQENFNNSLTNTEDHWSPQDIPAVQKELQNTSDNKKPIKSNGQNKRLKNQRSCEKQKIFQQSSDAQGPKDGNIFCKTTSGRQKTRTSLNMLLGEKSSENLKETKEDSKEKNNKLKNNENFSPKKKYSKKNTILEGDSGEEQVVFYPRELPPLENKIKDILGSSKHYLQKNISKASSENHGQKKQEKHSQSGSVLKNSMENSKKENFNKENPKKENLKGNSKKNNSEKKPQDLEPKEVSHENKNHEENTTMMNISKKTHNNLEEKNSLSSSQKKTQNNSQEKNSSSSSQKSTSLNKNHRILPHKNQSPRDKKNTEYVPQEKKIPKEFPQHHGQELSYNSLEKLPHHTPRQQQSGHDLEKSLESSKNTASLTTSREHVVGDKELLSLIKKETIIFLHEDFNSGEFALMDKGILELFDQENIHQETKKGNIYIGRVTSIKPALNAVFIDFGQQRQGFLPFSEIHGAYLRGDSFGKIIDNFIQEQEQSLSSSGDGTGTYGPSFQQDADALSQRLFGDIHHYLSLEAFSDAFDGLDNSFYDMKLKTIKLVEKNLRRGDLLFVQVTKDERDHKGACLTTYISLTGSASVFLPNTPRNSGISKKITSQVQRRELRDILHNLCLPKNTSLILRTASLSLSPEEIKQQWTELTNLWITILHQGHQWGEKLGDPSCFHSKNSPIDSFSEEKNLHSPNGQESKDEKNKKHKNSKKNITENHKEEDSHESAKNQSLDNQEHKGNHGRSLPENQWLPLPSVHLYREADFLLRCLREFYRQDIGYIVVEGEALFQTISSFVEKFFSFHKKGSLLLYDSKNHNGQSLFSFGGISAAMEEIYSPKVHLPSGGSLVFGKTEALTAIDVNSGRSTQEKNVHQTALLTNVEAATVIARQLRLRNLSGLIVVDFIDMAKEKFSLVEDALKKAIKWDKAKLKFGKISEFCLLELSRQRLSPSLLEKNTQKCHSCLGSGLMFSTSYLLKILLGKIKDVLNSQDIHGGVQKIFNLRAHPQGALLLLNEGRKELHHLEEHYGCHIYVYFQGSLPVKDIVMDRGVFPPGSHGQ